MNRRAQGRTVTFDPTGSSQRSSEKGICSALWVRHWKAEESNILLITLVFRTIWAHLAGIPCPGWDLVNWDWFMAPRWVDLNEWNPSRGLQLLDWHSHLYLVDAGPLLAEIVDAGRVEMFSRFHPLFEKWSKETQEDSLFRPAAGFA